MHSEKFAFNFDRTKAYCVSFISGCYSELEEYVEEHLPFMNWRSELRLFIAEGISEYEIILHDARDKILIFFKVRKTLFLPKDQILERTSLD